MRILITGAAGAGTSTLGRALARRLDIAFVEADDLYWCPTDPPYRCKRDAKDRLRRARDCLQRHPRLVMAGSVMRWGQSIEDAFDVIVFLYVDTATRLARLDARERARFGAAQPGFLDWAAQYDPGTAGGRSLEKHRQWLAQRPCPVIRLVGCMDVTEQLARLSHAGRSMPDLARIGRTH